MNIGKLGLLALAAGSAILASGSLQAQSQVAIERSGNTFHKAVCARSNAPGEARCHAHVVTDARGNEMAGKPIDAAPNITPSGLAPADLQSAYYGGSAPAGSTRTIVIVDAYGYPNAEADLGVYRAHYGLPA